MKLTVEYKDRFHILQAPGLLTAVLNEVGGVHRQDIISIRLGVDDIGEEIARFQLGDHEIIVYSKETDVIDHFTANYSKEIMMDIEFNDIRYCLYK